MQRIFPVESEKKNLYNFNEKKVQVVVSWSRIRKSSVKADHSFVGVQVRPNPPLLISGNSSCEWNNVLRNFRRERPRSSDILYIFQNVYVTFNFAPGIQFVFAQIQLSFGTTWIISKLSKHISTTFGQVSKFL